jgi:hypothetical protein
MASRDELDFEADLGMVRMVCTELLWKKFKNKSEGGEQGVPFTSHGSCYSCVRREIGRLMPTSGIRDAGSVRTIRTIKWRSNSLNGFSIEK